MNQNDGIESSLSRIESRFSRMESMMEKKLVQQYFTISEASELLRCSETTIRRMINENRLPFKRLSSTVKSTILIRRRDLLGILGRGGD
jgi:excisionase family DNA binding protein